MQQLGKYQLIRKLATGGMAEVYLAKAAGPMGFEKTLVVKRILPHLAEDPAFVEMFLGEAKLAAQLNHPHIVQIFDFGEADGEYFLAMEYIDGLNLRVLLKRAKAAGMALPPALCARLIASACEGLAFAHDFTDPATGELLGLIHRDISPDNILVSRQGAVKVVDFGIAKSAGQSHKTQSGVIKGKLAYMPPEQVRAKALDRRADVYALGVVLYELLTTHKPFDSTTDAGIMQAILFEQPVPAAKHRPDLPESLQQILARVLAKDREQRYTDCLALAADLEEFILSVGKPVTAQLIVQLIAQVAPSTDTPVPTPQSGTPRSGSGPKPSTTPVHTPAPSNVATSPGPRSDRHSAPVPPNGDIAAPEEDATAPVNPPTQTVPFTIPEVLAATERDAPVFSSQPRRWPLAVLGAGLILAGGGFLFWPVGSTPDPVTSSEVALPPSPPAAPATPASDPPSTPAATSAPQPSVPIAEVTPPQTESPSPTDPPATSPQAESADEGPPKVAEAPPPANPRPRPRAKPALTKPVGKGTLAFRVRPFATIFINGKNYGQTPIAPVELPAATYTVRLVNEQLQKNVTQTVELKPGENRVVKFNFEG